MSKKYKIVVSDTVAVQVKGALSDADGKPVSFKFTLACKRLGAEEYKARMEGESTTKDVMQEVTTGWSGQRLVLEEDGTPAEFCADALDALLDINGMANVCFVAYGKESGAHAKN
ncbi:MAG: hypothetical protein WA191_20765 [Telluria sp.]